MINLISIIGSTILGVVKSNNNRAICIEHDNNVTKIELAKIAVGGVALVGTIALKFYDSQKAGVSSETR